MSRQSPDQVGGYLATLKDKYRMVDRRLPIFAKPNARSGRYYIRDNFLRSWLAGLSNPVAATNFRPLNDLITAADQRLQDAEGFGLERLVATLYEERSRKVIGDFSLSSRIEGYWDRKGIEIDIIALDEVGKRIRFGTCKRSAGKLVADTGNMDGHIARFLTAFGKYRTWTVERVAIAPTIDADVRRQLRARGFTPEDLSDLTAGLYTARVISGP